MNTFQNGGGKNIPMSVNIHQQSTLSLRAMMKVQMPFQSNPFFLPLSDRQLNVTLFRINVIHWERSEVHCTLDVSSFVWGPEQCSVILAEANMIKALWQ